MIVKSREVRVLEKAVNDLEMKFHYDRRFKQRDMECNLDTKRVQHEPDSDPRIKLMKKCNENFDHLLPIFDKLVEKTLCLQNYQLSEGHV